MTDGSFFPDDRSGGLAAAILDAIPASLAVLDRQGRILAVNAAWRRFALDNAPTPGIMPAGCDVGANYLDVCEAARGADTEGAMEAAAGIRAVMAGQLPEFRLEYPCHGPETRRWFLMWATPLSRPESASVVVHVDITARKQAEMLARDNELRLNLALEASGDGLWDWNLATGSVYLSPSYYALTGYRPEDDTPNLAFFQRLVVPEDWPGVSATMDAHLRGETAISEIEYRIVRADGAQRWMHGRGRVVARDMAGTPTRMIGHVTDITTHKALEQSLRDSETRYRTLLEDQTEIIGRYLADGTLIYVNEVYCRLFGVVAEEVIGRRWQPAAHPDDLPMIEARLAVLSPTHPVTVIENRVVVAGGEVRWMQFVNRAFFDDSGALAELQAVGRDITERKRLEQEREALLAENTRLGHELIRLQEAERVRLARELHDEMSQELAAMRAYAGALRRRAGNGDDHIRSDAVAIESAAGRIYDVSHRIMEGLHPQVLASTHLGEALQALVLDLNRRHPAIRAWIRVVGQLEGLDGETRTHLYRIAQECLINIASHAQARRVRVWIGRGSRDGLPVVRLVCRDDGRGMDPDAPRRGLGLLMMRERARAMGGRFEFQSRPGKGARVEAEIPTAG